MKFAIAALFGLVAASNPETLAELQQETTEEPQLTFLSEDASEKMWLEQEQAILNAPDTHKIAEAEVNKLLRQAEHWGKGLEHLGKEEKALRTKNWKALMSKTAQWQKLKQDREAKFKAAVHYFTENTVVDRLPNGRKELYFENQQVLNKEVQALKAANKKLSFVVKQDIEAYMHNEQQITAYLQKKYNKTLKPGEKALKQQAKKTINALKDDINAVELDEELEQWVAIVLGLIAVIIIGWRAHHTGSS